MKICILTYHDANSFGAVLQTYALQTALKKIGRDSDILDYKCRAITNRNDNIKIKNFKGLIRWLLFSRANIKNNESFMIFRTENLKLSDKTYNTENINRANELYNVFIVGSDQVWNMELSDEDFTYFLNFVDQKNKKISYAASFGYDEIPDKYLDTTKECLSDFNMISVREASTIKMLDAINIENAVVTLDPTLLLDKREWKIFIKDRLVHGKYILLYVVAHVPGAFDFTRSLARHTGCEIIYINLSKKPQYGMKNRKPKGIDEILNLLYYAEYAVTSSYHGLLFAINFNTKFYYGLSDDPNNYNSRINNISDLLNIKDRQIDQCSAENMQDDIDWTSIEKILSEKRALSFKFLKEIFN